MSIKKYILFIILSLFCLGNAWADSVEEKQVVRVSLISQSPHMAAGKPVKLGILLEPLKNWHTYWETPGDAGLPTSLRWTLPEGFSAGNIDWPPPQKIPEGPLMVYGYQGTVFLPVTITPPTTLAAGSEYTFKVFVEMLVCKDICIPQSADLDITLTVGDTAIPSERAEFFANHVSPVKIPEPVLITLNTDNFVLTVPRVALGTQTISDAYFFPRQTSLVVYSAPQKMVLDDIHLTLTIERASTEPEGNPSGILYILDNSGSEKWFDIGLKNASSALTSYNSESFLPVTVESKKGESLFVLLSFALLGGLILNLMPCVLPVLSLKALAIVKKSGHAHAHIIRLGIAYTLGILASFALLGGLLISLQQAGTAVGWGYQMQSPAFVGFLIYLLFLVGLNLSGLFHLPVLLGNAGSKLAHEDSARGSFLTGVLAVGVATPCTAPFMASAVGAALTLPGWQAMLVFLSLGLGLALPFLLISLFPTLLRILPKPGAWMETLKQFLAFPMYASVIWLLWVLTLQAGAGGMAVALIGLLTIILAIWMKPLFQTAYAYRFTALMILTIVLGWSLLKIDMSGNEMLLNIPPVMHGAKTVPYSKEKLDELRASGKPVFVDATAAWCITCQLNGRVIHSGPVMEAFANNTVTLMIADWTRRNDEISEFLKSFGYQGVPLYVFFPAEGNPVVLPQLLTESVIIETITQ